MGGGWAVSPAEEEQGFSPECGNPLAGRWGDEGCNLVLVCKLGGFPGET